MTRTFRLALFAAAALAPALLAPAANAGEWYGSVSAGVTQDADVSGLPLESELAYGAHLGTSVSFLRVQVGVEHIAGSFDFGGPSINASALDYQAYAFADFPIGDNASLFVGGGFDYIDGEARIFTSSIDASGTGYSLAAGGAVRLNDRLSFEAQVRQLEADGLDSDYGSVDLSATVVTGALRFKLG